ncbi:hypothetical protein BDA96_05G104600 [Sorghum bicolor]|uniref:F-box domain-containing protein n=2 Tax=Sorghum bicolor TaxID=4558 RepID=A0A921UF98_SORBI|nr:hypothetical protein BDA96_05G104600 [Sorghum bicolor]OQU83272.1 hypothetical protein SORBI_3005G101100 [Sorghum bicolor]
MTLPDDLLISIFLFLPPQPSYLLRSSLVCKHWHSLIVDNRFLHRVQALHGLPLLGVFTNSTRIPRFLPAGDPPNRVAAASFSLPDLYWNVLGCRHGHVLLVDSTWHQVFVWNPINGRKRLIQAPSDVDPRFNYGNVPESNKNKAAEPFPPLHSCRLAAAAARLQGREGGQMEGRKGGRRSWETEGRRGEEEELGDRRDERSGEERRAAMEVAAAAGQEERRGMNVFNAAVVCAANHADHGYCHSCPFFVVWVFTSTRYAYATRYSSESGRWDMMESSPIPSDLDFRPSILVRNILHKTEDGGLGLAALAKFNLRLWAWETDAEGVTGWVLRRVIELDLFLPLDVSSLPSPDNGSCGRPPVRILGLVEDTDLVFLWTITGVFAVHLKSMKFKKVFEADVSATVYPYKGFRIAGLVGCGGGNVAAE